MAFSELAARWAMFSPGTTVLCAVSGGADSMYLLERLREEAERLEIRVTAAHFDHRLRPTSGEDAEFVRRWCRERDVPCAVGSADVAGAARELGRGVEETARELRYDFLRKAARELGADVIATAHTADDNAETLLLHLTRGSGLDGLCGIPPRRDDLVRPLLDVTRGEIEAWLSARGIPHVEDESNGDLRYTRNFIRHRVMPLLKEVNPRAADHMTGAALRLREEREALEEQARAVTDRAVTDGLGWRVPCAAFYGVPDAVAVRAARELILRAGGRDLTAAHLTAALRLIRGEDPSAALDLSGARLRREYGDLLGGPAEEAAEPLPRRTLRPGDRLCWGGWTVSCESVLCPRDAAHTKTEFWLSRPENGAELVLRPRREGDRLRPVGRPEKTVKKWFVDEKIPRALRERVPILEAEDRAAAVGGLGPDERWLAKAGRPALHIILKQDEGAEHHAS